MRDSTQKCGEKRNGWVKYYLRLAFFLTLVFILTACAGKEDEVVSMTTKIPNSQTLDWWHPKTGLTWQWQLTGKFNFSIKADVYDIDLYAPKEAVDLLHQQGSKVICYISVGSWEDWRPDADQFPEEVLGKDYEGWKGERWLDIRRIDLLAPIMRARLDLCAEKGFDAVEPDNIEIYTNDTGFPLSYQDQLAYAEWLANEAHARGLAIGLKNAPDQVGDLVDLYDFAITEDCFYYGWCEEMKPFIDAGKPVFAAEYTDLGGDFDAYCQEAEQLGFSTILKRRNLGSWVKFCP